MEGQTCWRRILEWSLKLLATLQVLSAFTRLP